MTILQAIILSIVEGVTEFLPISSTGHLVLASALMRVSQTEFVKSFEIAIQLGAILAVIGLYLRTKLRLKGILVRLAAAFIPTAVVGFVLYSFIKDYLLGNTAVTLWALLIGGIAIIIVERYLQKKLLGVQREINDLTLFEAVLVGLGQAVAVVPGVSRAAATIIGGRLLGLSRVAAVEFSFLLAVPTLLAATGLDAIKTGWHFAGNEWLLLAIGFVGAYVSALFAVKYFLKLVQNYSLIPFGVYRIVLAGVLLLVL